MILKTSSDFCFFVNLVLKFVVTCFSSAEVKTEEKIQDTKGVASKECKTSSHSTPDEAASDPPSELEEDNVDPNSPEGKSVC